MFSIIPGVATPAPSSQRKYPFDQLNVSVLDSKTGYYVGDMFFVAGRTKNNLTTHASATGTKLGKQFLTRMLYMANNKEVAEHVEGAVLGVGVWRIA